MAFDQNWPTPAVPDAVDCLKCRKSFNSPDKRRVRICPPCTRENSRPSSRQPVDLHFDLRELEEGDDDF